MDIKGTLKAITLELRHILEGSYDSRGVWQPGDLERRLAAIGVRRDRGSVPVSELPLLPEDREARRVIDAFIESWAEAGLKHEKAIAELVRNSAYTWANRLLALRCMEARGLIEEVILQKDAYGGRSLQHNRLARKQPERCAGEDEGLFALLLDQFKERAKELTLLFDLNAPEVALRPSVAALKRCIALLSGTLAVKGQGPAADDVFTAPDALGWTYQYWNKEEKDRVDEWLKSKKGFKCEGVDIIYKTGLYTEPYMVKFLVQNSLGATWAGIRPDTKLTGGWEYYIKGADRAAVERKPVREITFLDPACGSGHFLLEAFDLFYSMYEEEGETTNPEAICSAILERNLYGIDIDERAIQISEAVLWMKSAEKVLQATGSVSFPAVKGNLVATNIHLPKGVDHLKVFLDKHPEDKDLSPALEIVFKGLENADELGSLLQIEGPVDRKLKELQQSSAELHRRAPQAHLYEPTLQQEQLPTGVVSYDEWKRRTLARLKEHFLSEATTSGLSDTFFSRAATRGLELFDLLARRYDVVTANPPYLGSSNFGEVVKQYVFSRYSAAKADLYSAFILRCVQLAGAGHRVAMVTQQSWMYLKSFAQLRFNGSADEDSFSGLLKATTVELLIHLGPGSFREIGGEVVNSVLFVLSITVPQEQHRLTAVSVTDVDNPDNKAYTLRRAATGSVLDRVFQPLQSALLTIPDVPLVYQLRDEFARLLSSGSDLGSNADVKPGPQTSDNTRFNRLFWEATNLGSRWFPLSKGGGFKRWKGLNHLVIDWQFDGLRIKEFNQRSGDHWSRNVRNVSFIFKEGITYSAFSSAFSARVLTKQEICDTKGPGIYCGPSLRLPLLGYLNTRITQYILKLLSPTLDFNPRNIAKLPVPQVLPPDNVVHCVLQLKEMLTACEMPEYSFSGKLMNGSLRNSISALVCLAEHYIEKSSADSLALSPAARRAVADYAGSPAGSLPLVVGFDELPEVEGWQAPSELREEHMHLPRVRMAEGELAELKKNLKNAYASYDRLSLKLPGTERQEDQLSEEEELVSFLQSSIPKESAVEGLAYLLHINPISVHWLVERAEKNEGWEDPTIPECLKDRASLLLLRILGHRWPLDAIIEVEVAPDGVIAISNSSSEGLADMLARVTDGSLQREFAEALGIPLIDWFSRQFFQDHATQFKRRPVAWHLRSDNGLGRRDPALQIILYYGRLQAQTIALIQSQFLRPRRQRYETEMRSIESISQSTRTDRQHERLLELSGLINDLRAFDEQLEEISRSGFGPKELRPLLRQYGTDDAVLCLKAQWLQKLSDTISSGPLPTWRDNADNARLHPNLAQWIETSMSRLRRHCSVLAPAVPKVETLQDDPTSTSLASLICRNPGEMAEGALKLACIDWFRPLDEAVLAPLRTQIKLAKDELKALKSEDYSTAKDPFKRRKEIDARTKELKENIKRSERDLNEKTAAADRLRDKIGAWKCLEARKWEGWLAAQPMYDAVSSLDGIRRAPCSITEWVAQESSYAPDINDGVRVNIAPLQRAGILAADVLAAKDVDKAIADRAEWRADERRWCREGKLPRPGWWPDEDAAS